MNTFVNISESLVRPEALSYFMVREFAFDQSKQRAVEDFMQTRYFCWQEEFRNEVEITNDNGRHYVDWNFHGFSDIKKMKQEHFVKVGALEFVQRFMTFIELQIGADPKLPEIEILLKDLVDIKSQFYIISELSEDIHHEWTVYEFFISGFKINPDKKLLTAIEFGLD
ncbi:hypothetical protein [Owenweeksia hongkongensis]|uniref:hypothetical protein n=1 Tax=Owenweeksia hongkongensis TaxID=253245 RepID=UPI003A928AEC